MAKSKKELEVVPVEDTTNDAKSQAAPGFLVKDLGMGWYELLNGQRGHKIYLQKFILNQKFESAGVVFKTPSENESQIEFAKKEFETYTVDNAFDDGRFHKMLALQSLFEYLSKRFDETKEQI